MFWRRKAGLSVDELLYVGWMREANRPCEKLVMDEYAVYGDDVAALIDWGGRAGPVFRRVRGEFDRSEPPTQRLAQIRDSYVSSMDSFERCAELWSQSDIDGAVMYGNDAVRRWDHAVAAVDKLR